MLFWKKKMPELTDCVYFCLKEKCPKWVILNNIITLDNGQTETKTEGRCAIAWIPTLLVELKGVIK